MNLSGLQEMNKKICRLCLKTVVDNGVIITEDISLDISSVLLFLYLDVSGNPVMCAECEKSLQNAIDFKNSRKMIGDISLDSEIFQYINKCKSPSELSESQQVELCHFCLNYPIEHWCLPKIECNVFLSEIFCEIRTELNVPSLEDPVACQKCNYIIQDILRFTRTGLKVEEKIKRFVEAEGADSKSQINLKEVQMFQSDERDSNDYESEPDYFRRTSQVEVLENFDVKNECEIDNYEEGYEDNIIVKSENEDSVTLTVNCLNDESSFDVDGFTQTPIKNEAVEIKTEEDDSNSSRSRRNVEAPASANFEAFNTGFEDEFVPLKETAILVWSSDSNCKSSDWKLGAEGIPENARRGKRKKTMCKFCSSKVTNFHRHLIRQHKDREEVAEILSLPKKSTRRLQIISLLRNEGRFEEYLNGKVRPVRLSANKSEENYRPCPNCKGLYSRKSLFRHKPRCPAIALSRDSKKIDGTSEAVCAKKVTTKIRKNKKMFCIFCALEVTNFVGHLIRHHRDRIKVPEISRLPESSTERVPIVKLVRYEGRLRDNPIPTHPTSKQPKEDPCVYCKGLYCKKKLFSQRKCPAATFGKGMENEVEVDLASQSELDGCDSGETDIDVRSEYLLPSSPSDQKLSAEKCNKKRRTVCKFCSFEVTNFHRHLIRHHKDSEEVIKILSLPKKSKQRLQIMSLLRNEGHFEEYLRGNVRPVYRKANKSKEQYSPCKHCKGLYCRMFLMRHQKTCPAVRLNKDLNKTESQSAATDSNTDAKPKSENNDGSSFSCKVKDLKVSGRAVWTRKEIEIVKQHFQHHILQKITPRKHECEELIEQYPDLLGKKGWVRVKTYVYNVFRMNSDWQV